MRLIQGEESQLCQIDKAIVKQHFKRVSRPKPCDKLIQQRRTTANRQTRHLHKQEVMMRLRRCENTSPGDDWLTYNHLRSVDPACTVIAAIFNLCLKYERIPEDWKTSTTVLIYKKGHPEDVTNWIPTVTNWRPIAILRTIYKLYTGVLAKRTTQWLINNKVLSPARKASCRMTGSLNTTIHCKESSTKQELFYIDGR